LNVADGYFECKFKNYTASASNGADTANWVICRYSSEGGSLLDSITSEMTIKKNNEQIIPKWGVSVQIRQLNYAGSGAIYDRTTTIISSSIEFADSSKQWLSFVRDNDSYYPTNWVRSGSYTPLTDPSASPYDCLPDALPYLNPCNYKDEAGIDDEKNYAKLLNGGIAPHRLTGYEADYMPLAYFNYAESSIQITRKMASLSFLPSIDIVITSDRTKWTRCPVIELGRDAALNIGACQPGAMRKSPSVNKYGASDGTGTGMGWFPGYAIDLETGARLYMAFGENSFHGIDGGADMIWNPSDRLVDGVGNPVMGGAQPIWVFNHDQSTINNYSIPGNFPAYIPSEGIDNSTNYLFQRLLEIESNNSTAKRHVYSNLAWIAYPILTEGQTVLSSDVKIRLRVNKEYKDYAVTGENGGRPMYSWNMNSVSTQTNSDAALTDVLKLINVVPNPYNAFSEYENNKLDSRVKITNLPEKCTIRIYNSQGKLIKLIKKDSPVTYQDWTLTNHANIPISSGVYLIHVEVPGIGETVVKAFVAMRMVDLQNL
jgi:predicted DNA-binding ArsR family transcriptional regulator